MLDVLWFPTVLLASHSFVSLFSFQGTPRGGRFAWFLPRSCSLFCLVSRTLWYGFLAVGRSRSFYRAFALCCVSAFLPFNPVPRLLSLAVCTRWNAKCPALAVVGSNGLEPSTSRLSGVRSNHLSYEPISVAGRFHRPNLLLRLFRLLTPRLPTSSFNELDPRCVLGGHAVVETNRIELSTPCLQGRCSPS